MHGYSAEVFDRDGKSREPEAGTIHCIDEMVKKERYRGAA